MTEPPPTTNPLGTETFYWNVEYPLCRHSVRIEYRSDSPSAHASYRFRVRPWIPHDGGPCPVDPHVRVRVRTRDGHSYPGSAPAWYYEAPFLNQWTWQSKFGISDIIAYQIIED